MRRKKDCTDCRALYGITGGPNGICQLGYPIIHIEKPGPGNYKFYVPTPAEPCPKPKTYSKFFNADRYEEKQK